MRQGDTVITEIIRSEVEKYFHFKIKVHGRERIMVWARSIYFKLVKHYTKMSLREIGESLHIINHKDHATVLYAIRELKEYRRFIECNKAFIEIERGVKDFFPNQDLINLNILNDIKSINDLKRYEHFAKRYLIIQRKNQRLMELLKAKGADEIDLMIRTLNIEQQNELKQYRVIPFLRMRGKFNTQEI